MHPYTTYIEVSLTGKKDNVIHMLNTAMHSAGSANVIAEGDDMESILQKVKEVDDCQQFLLPDFMDEKSIQECGLQEKLYGCRHEGKDDCYDWVSIRSITEDGEKYTLELESVAHEEVEVFGMSDWEVWGKKASRLYQCRIVMKQDCVGDGLLESYLFTFDPEGPLMHLEYTESTY